MTPRDLLKRAALLRKRGQQLCREADMLEQVAQQIAAAKAPRRRARRTPRRPAAKA